MMSLPKTMEYNGKMLTSTEPNKKYIYIYIYIYRWKGFDESYSKNGIFIEFEPLCQKLWAFLSNLPKPLTKYGHVTRLWLEIPKIVIFRLILY